VKIKTMTVKEYFAPTSLEEAVTLSTESSTAVWFLAGGTDLMIQMTNRGAPDVRCISLKNIEALKGISVQGDGKIFIGAMVSHADVASDALINQCFPALAEASGLVGAPSIRNMGTIGGNICNASPSADAAPPLLVYEAHALIWRPEGETLVNFEDFLKGPSQTILETGDILKGFLLIQQEGMIARYEKLGYRKAMEIAIVNVCVALIVDKAGSCKKIRIALGAVAPTPIRAKNAENILEGKRITDSMIHDTAEAAMGEAVPISDIRASAGYRREMVGVLVEKAISSIMEGQT
jgi:CO/xanthine dehydrogenase FAD-binding subunit